MKKLTVAEKRTKAVIELANRTTGNIENARKAMNAYYRLCGLEERLLYLENDDFKEEISMNFKFKNAVLPCNEKEDFNTKDISVDIICRIFLSEAPSKEHEQIAKELDGDNYSPDCFFIEAIAGKNEPDGDILTSGWHLGYVTKSDNPMNELGYVADDINGAWEFFKKEIGVDF